MWRYETRFTMMTSNRLLVNWNKSNGDAPFATAILDRVLSHPITSKSCLVAAPHAARRWRGHGSTKKKADVAVGLLDTLR